MTVTQVQEEVAKTSKTEVLKRHVQAIIQQTLDVKVSKGKAWDLFKALIHGSVELTLAVEGKSIPLAGVGTFQVLETKPRGLKAGLDKEGNPIEGAKVWPTVPRFRFYPSTNIDKGLEQKYGLADHGITETHYGLFCDDVQEKADKEEKSESVVQPEGAEVPAPAPASVNNAGDTDEI